MSSLILVHLLGNTQITSGTSNTAKLNRSGTSWGPRHGTHPHIPPRTPRSHPGENPMRVPRVCRVQMYQPLCHTATLAKPQGKLKGGVTAEVNVHHTQPMQPLSNGQVAALTCMQEAASTPCADVDVAQAEQPLHQSQAAAPTRELKCVLAHVGRIAAPLAEQQLGHREMSTGARRTEGRTHFGSTNWIPAAGKVGRHRCQVALATRIAQHHCAPLYCFVCVSSHDGTHPCVPRATPCLQLVHGGGKPDVLGVQGQQPSTDMRVATNDRRPPGCTTTWQWQGNPHSRPFGKAGLRMCGCPHHRGHAATEQQRGGRSDTRPRREGPTHNGCPRGLLRAETWPRPGHPGNKQCQTPPSPRHRASQREPGRRRTTCGLKDCDSGRASSCIRYSAHPRVPHRAPHL
jgi:hypothetical protein